MNNNILKPLKFPKPFLNQRKKCEQKEIHTKEQQE